MAAWAAAGAEAALAQADTSASGPYSDFNLTLNAYFRAAGEAVDHSNEKDGFVA